LAICHRLFAMPLSLVEHSLRPAFPTGASCSTTRNFRPPALSLPLDLVFIVFHQLPPSCRIRATHVCSQWRAFPTKLPLLWSEIPGGSSIDCLATFLARAEGVPVDVNQLLVQSDEDPKLELVAAQLHRIRSLELLLNGAEDIGYASHGLCLFRTSAPILESLVIRNLNGRGHFYITDETFGSIFARNAPRLYSIGLFEVPNSLGFLMRLPQPFVAREVSINYGVHPAPTDVDVSVAAALPNVLKLHVSNVGWTIAPERTGLGSLHTLHLRPNFSTNQVSNHLMKTLHGWSKLHAIWLELPDSMRSTFWACQIPMCVGETYRSVEATVIWTHDQTTQTREQLCTRAVTPKGRTRVFSNFSLKDLDFILSRITAPDLARQLEEIKFDACTRRAAWVFDGIPLPSLRVLCFVAGERYPDGVDVMMRRDSRKDFADFIHRMHGVLWHVPNLERLELEVIGLRDGDPGHWFWTTRRVMYIMNSFSLIRKGFKFPEVVLRGFIPESGLVGSLERFSEKVTVTSDMK